MGNPQDEESAPTEAEVAAAEAEFSSAIDMIDELLQQAADASRPEVQRAAAIELARTSLRSLQGIVYTAAGRT